MNAQLMVTFPDAEQQIVDETSIWHQVQDYIASLPDKCAELMPGLAWGSVYEVYTPAFWKYQYMINRFPENHDTHRLSESLSDEVIMCMLGGYGIPSEMGILAFDRLKSLGLTRVNTSFEAIFDALSAKFIIRTDKAVHYRFAKQKARYIAEFLNRNDIDNMPQADDLQLRSWLTTVKGIGYKTASWITRNWLRSERVAILDIHLLRAGIITGFFWQDTNVNTEYLLLEEAYLRFCAGLNVRPSDMDAVIWWFMKKNNRLAIDILSKST